MNEQDLSTYCQLEQQDEGVNTYFRKFETCVFVFQYKKGKLIGQLMLSHDGFNAIYNAPTIKKGDAVTKQTL